MRTQLFQALLQLTTYTRESLLSMGWVDVLDVAVMATFLCLSLVWLQRRTSRTVLVVLIPTLLTFWVAKRLNMYLTSKVFQGV